MNLPDSIPGRMSYIQNLFLAVQDYMQNDHDFESIIKYLEAEPAEYRSIAYESASMQIALTDLLVNKQLENWKYFYNQSSIEHSFHMEIGLGWAFAKNEVSPTPYIKSFPPTMNLMVFDGIGYYYALYKGRKTVKSQSLPDEFEITNIQGFDQGVGRRLWYICKGDVDKLVELIQSLNQNRHADLFRGVGIACGYVGGSDKYKLEQLLKFSGKFQEQLCNGVSLAAISRKNSNSLNKDIELASNVICGKPLYNDENENELKKVLF
jgi:enediyne biosynthesis protein E3